MDRRAAGLRAAGQPGWGAQGGDVGAARHRRGEWCRRARGGAAGSARASWGCALGPRPTPVTERHRHSDAPSDRRGFRRLAQYGLGWPAPSDGVRVLLRHGLALTRSSFRTAEHRQVSAAAQPRHTARMPHWPPRRHRRAPSTLGRLPGHHRSALRSLVACDAAATPRRTNVPDTASTHVRLASGQRPSDEPGRLSDSSAEYGLTVRLSSRWSDSASVTRSAG